MGKKEPEEVKRPRNMVLDKTDLEYILKNVYGSEDFDWKEPINNVSPWAVWFRCSHVRMLDKIKFADSVKSGSGFAGT